MVGLSMAAMAGLLLPVLLIGLDATSNPQVVQSLIEHPGSAVLLSGGIMVGLGLLTFPLRAGLARLGSSGRVQMADGMVDVERKAVLGTERWSERLSAFCGVTHHIRATLSGPRHEIILVHPEPNRDVLLHLSSRHPQEGADHYARLLGLAELQPRELYSRRRSPPASIAPKPGPAGTELQARAA